MIGRVISAVFTGFPPRRLIMIVSLIGAWCVLWGSLSAANLLSGAAAAVVVTAPGLGGALTGGVRPIPLARLTWLVLVDLFKSSADVTRITLTPTDRTSESIIAATVPSEARRYMLLYTTAITLTPGTIVVDTDAEAGTLFIHLLDDSDVAATIAHIDRLAELTCLAFPPVESGEAFGSGGST